MQAGILNVAGCNLIIKKFQWDGDEWLKYRKVMNVLMLRGDTTEIESASTLSAKRLIDKLCDINTNKLKNCDSNVIEIPKLEKLLYRWSIDDLIYVMLGINTANDTNLANLEKIIDLFAKNVHKVFEYSAKLNIIPPTLARKFNFKMWKNFEESVTITLALAKQIIDISIDELGGGDGLLVSMQKEGISRENIQRIFADLIIAAGDTTAFSTQWALYLLAQNPDVQAHIRNVILNDKTKSNEIPLVRGTLREAMRLYPVAPFIGRFMATDAVIGNYKIPKDTLVLLSIFTSGRNPNYFTNPLKFSPSRWSRETVPKNELVVKSQASLPYAMGSRSCIGRKVANNMMHVLLTTIIRNFELKLINKNEIKPILRMITVPSEDIRISIKSIN